MKNKKQRKQKKQFKKTVKRQQKKQDVNIKVHVIQQPQSNKGLSLTTVGPQVLDPIQDNKGKYTIAKTWLSEKQILKILQRTPKEFIYTRPAKGGGTWDYVPGGYVEKVLNYAFGWNWDFEIIKQEIIGEQVITLGKLTVKDGTGQSVTKTQNGRADIKCLKGKPHNPENYLDVGNDFKASATDAMKKCASMLGIASDIYGKREFRDVGVVVKNDNRTDKTGATHNQEEKIKNNPPEIEIEAECHECGNPMTKAEAEFSKRVYKKQLCRTCQNTYKNLK
ncbi:RAD52 family DNA repair protein [bacterium]|jgi:hypothetical protein|nr:RAD52 family DNA repair protein [bacterium]